MHRKSRSEALFPIVNACLLTVISFVCLYPVLHVVAASFSDPARLNAHQGLLLFPQGFTLKGYEYALRNPNIISGYKNTLVYVVSGTVINMILTALGAYVCSRKNAMFVRPLMMLIVFTMYFGGGLIPWFIVLKNLSLINNVWAMILPGAISTYNLIVMRTSFLGIPDSLEESARIDGANDFVILFRIILPLSKAVLAVILLYYAVGHWNSWFNASILLTSREKYPLQLILRDILISNNKGAAVQNIVSPVERNQYQDLIQYSTIVIGTLPVFFLYPFLQKYFTKGVMIGGVKG
ncbi:carbohydrate ABC transporter permease [Ruminococcaceae bacterium OttesenSCG-928-L11]|nr:carbohydrate ABC transporter permease [Ruminococcaceae bacterium OttesenSCG-928-L11]